MGSLVKLKMQNHGTRSASENRALNVRLKTLFNAMDANADINALIASLDGHAHWARLGSLIESWSKCEFNVAQQSFEMGELFKDVMASKGVDVGVKGGKLKVRGKTAEARGMAEWMGFDAEGRCNRKVAPVLWRTFFESEG
ncbi:MAG: hypothetical protein Q9211_001443 [Gyalolechia sp. 1 TL-2023]